MPARSFSCPASASIRASARPRAPSRRRSRSSTPSTAFLSTASVSSCACIDSKSDPARFSSVAACCSVSACSLAAPSSRWVVSVDSFSSRASVSSAVAARRIPSLNLAICCSIDQTISCTRLDWTRACSTVCCWLSIALALSETRSARALSATRRSSVSCPSAWSCASGPSFFSASLIAATAADESSRAVREVSPIRAHSSVSPLVIPRSCSSSWSSAPARSTDCSSSACVERSWPRSSSNAVCSSLRAPRLACACRA